MIGIPAWYPAAGYRDGASSALASIGTYGYDWSSSVSGANGLHLRVLGTEVQSARANARSHGFSVRCLHI